MVTIPDEVKALFSSDTVHKNFHVTFPNGETSDLNNENVISESVKFTESLCSQQYFKFGLSEASQIEFTAVGIPNVRGAYIECAIESDCTRLGAAWAAAHPVDASLPFLAPQTCQYNSKMYYRVPYGRFKVDTCPRDHGAMWQRQITAYSDISLNVDIETAQDEVDEVFTSQPTYTPNLKSLVDALSFKGNEANLANYGYSSVSRTFAKATDTQSFGTVTFSGKDSGGNTTTYSYSAHGFSNYNPWTNETADKCIYSFTDMMDKATVIAAFSPYLENAGFDYAQSGYASWDELLDAFWDDLTDPANAISAYVMPSDGINRYYPQDGDLVYIGRFGQRWLLRMPVYFVDANTSQTVCDFEPVVTRYYQDSVTTIGSVTLLLNSTLQQKSNGKKYYSFVNAYSARDMAVGFLELCGWFLKPDRNGALDFFQMSLNPTPIAISASDWESFWWDETPIESIGQVNVIYTKDNEEQQETFSIGSGNSVYTIENNEVLKAAEMDATTMESILNTYFAPNASVVNFTPVDLVMRGLPFLESGDYIELTAEDGEIVDTYILSQTISGIQHLTAEITSTNGNLLEVIE